MKKKILSIFTVLIILLLAIGLVACSDYTPPKDDEEEVASKTYSHTITNGTFYGASTTSTDDSGDKAILDTLTSWTQTSGSITTSKNGSNGVLAAAVDLKDETVFNSFADKYLKVSVDDNKNALETPKTMKYPGLDSANIPMVDKLDSDGNVIYGAEGKAEKVPEDTNALVIASVETKGSLYVKGSSSYTLEKDSHYLLQFSVCTMIDAETTDADYNNKGAWFIVKGDVEYTVSCINTDNAWKTYYLFIETNKYSSLSINVEMWLGYGPGVSTSSSYANDQKDLYSTRGVALFDNVLCEKVETSKLTTAISGNVMSVNNGYTYDAEKSNHENFLNFKSALNSTADAKGNKFVRATSDYYFNNASMELRSHVTSYTTGSYRKYFYTYRENYSTSNLYDWTLKSSESSLDKKWYGSVDLSKLYNLSTEEDTSSIVNNYSTTLGSSYPFNAVSYSDWYTKVMRDANHNLTLADETYAMMIYNKDLQANSINSSDKITIEPNTYYEISVWAYVWAKTYSDGDFKYFPDFSEASPVDPETKFTTDEARQYYLYKNDKFVDYYEALSSAEEDKAKAFDAAELGNLVFGNSATEGYRTDEAIWLRAKLGLASDADVNSLLDDYFYTYLYSIKSSWSADLEAKADALEKAYLAERRANWAVVSGLIKKVDEYKEACDAYDIKKAAYDSKYQVWENNADNANGPYATVSLTGAGDGIKANTTQLGQWEKITLYVQGNQLSSRQVTLELALGTGTDYSTYMIGGVYFDNVEIVAYEDIADAPTGITWSVLSEITDTNQIAFGGLYGNGEITEGSDVANAIINNNWKVETADGTATSDANQVELSVLNGGVGNIGIGGTSYNLYALSYTNKIKTASTLSYKGNDALEIAPNKFYRFAFLVKTVDVDEKLGITIALMKGENKDDLGTSLDSTVTKYTNNSEEWAEIVYYVSGDIVDTYYLGLNVTMGSGTRFSTDSYVSGTVMLAAFNCMEIDYDEYTAAATGDKIVKSLSLYNISYDLDKATINFTNSYYSKINYEKTDKEAFDETGKLTGIGTTQDWTVSDITSNSYTAPSNVTVDGNKKLTWTGTTGYTGVNTVTETAPSYYEIWIKYAKDDEIVEKLFDTVEATAANTNYSYDLETVTGESDNWVLSYFAVKAVGSDGVSTLSSYTGNALGVNNGTVIPEVRTSQKKAEVKAGTIVVANQTDALFGDVNGVDYVSPYPTLFKISGSYNSVVGATCSSKSLSSDKYYKISVWVRTDVGTYASITIEDASGSLQASTNSSQLGFVYVTTNGEWKEYCFFVKTSNFDASLKVKLSLGNPYVKAKTGKIGTNSDSKTYYSTADLSKGNVYFDAVKIAEIKENEFDAAKNADENKPSTDVYASKNHEYVYKTIPYYIYIMEYAIDSFDAYKESSSSELGNEPTNYNRAYDTDLTKSNTLATYGIYDKTSTAENMTSAIEYLYKSKDSNSESTYAFNKVFKNLFGNNFNCADWGDEEWNAFMNNFLSIDRKGASGETLYEGGNNVLVMSNKAESGYAQSYTLNSSYNGTIEAGAYAKITFTARTLLARVISTTSKDESGKTVTTYSYALDEAFGEMRVIPSTAKDDKVNVKVNSYVYGQENDIYGAVTYTVYLYNKSTEKNTVNWAFYLGDEPSTAADATVFDKYLVGLMAVDLVSMETIDETEYAAAKADNASTSNFYEYKEKVKDDTETPSEDPTDPEEKQSFWEKLFANEYFWLYISSFVIAIAIIITVICVLVSRWKKKHPKQVVGENIVKTEKDIKVVPTTPQVKEDALEADEYIDEIKPVYVQRRVNNGKKKKKK